MATAHFSLDREFGIYRAAGSWHGDAVRKDRAGIVVFGGLVAAMSAWILYQHGPAGAGWFPRCWFHRLTGLACPGCGMTRAAHAALHGRLAEAFRFNPLGMLVLPALVIGLGLRIPAWLGDRPPPFRVAIGPRGVAWLVGVVVGYWLLRNLPVWPCTLLAPP